ncbi:hypothetical protein P280DRAFT_471159 [Massarina eburnea CBS 473.64]|uniref:Inactive metallocarboxypeptidase ECM14 n=1 Tax=Massarina eburnea CBS 473.64 TaxID=1395130 RepID=A0A6A6RWJ1_9PLEO|nr:hypothetical protein P280DRAFT_471159 [Massarina eburnea CBS 473.64]
MHLPRAVLGLPLSLPLALLLSPELAVAAPHASSRYDRDLTTGAPRPWRKLSEAIIRRIWTLPDEQHSLRPHADHPGAHHPTPGRRLLALYGGDIVLRFTIRTADEAAALAEASRILFLDVWEFNANWVDIRLAKDTVPSLLGLLPPSLQKSHEPLMQDLDLAQAVFDSFPSPSATQTHDADHHSYAPNLKSPAPSTRGHPFFKDYQPLSVINPWMNLMASMFTTHVRRINVGISYEGRDIPALRIGVHPTNNEQEPVRRKTILIVGGSHAREWISTSTVNYLAWTLINSYGKDRATTRLLEQFDFVLVPTLNPDGYVFSWETDRLWRKNRQPTSLRFCHGIDLDRSYPFQWEGASRPTNPCSESFAGEAPFEGVEAQRFAAWAKNETENNNIDFVSFLDLHSYSQQILYPYSYTCQDDPPTLETLEELAIGLAKAIRVSRKGHQYKVTSACEGNVLMSKDSKDKKDQIVLPHIESSGGSMLDYFYHELKIKYSFQIKLRDTGSYGFLLPKDNIIPTGEEIVDAVHYLGRFMLGEIGIMEDAPNAQPEKPLLKPSQIEEDSINETETETLEL